MALEIIPGHAVLTGLTLCYVAGETTNLADGSALTIAGSPTVTTDGSGTWLNCPTISDYIESTGGQFVSGSTWYVIAVTFRVKDLYPSGGSGQANYMFAQKTSLHGNASWTRVGFTHGSQTERAWVNYRVTGGTQFTSGTTATVRRWGFYAGGGQDLERFNSAEGAIAGGSSISTTGQDGTRVYIGANLVEGFGSALLEIDNLWVWNGSGSTPSVTAWRTAVDNGRSLLQTVGGGGASPLPPANAPILNQSAGRASFY